MAQVHIFISRGRFKSFKEMRSYIDPIYTEDGEATDSAFIKEVQLSEYEPMCIEAVHSEKVVPLAVLLKDASYSEQWLSKLDLTKEADATICVFEPNKVNHPKGSSMEYCGAHFYEA